MKFLLLIFAIFVFSLTVFGQNSGRIYTEEEVRQAIQEAKENCDCPDQTPPTRAAITSGSADPGYFTIMLFGGLNYMYGTENSDLSFNRDFIGWAGEIMLGYSYRNSSGGDGSSFGLFVQAGELNIPSLERLITEGGINKAFSNEDNNIFYNIEGGIIIAGFLRISTGLGFQEYETESSNLNRINYYSTTPGILVGSKNVKLSINLNFMYGRNLNQTIYKPSAGLAIKF